MTARSIREQVRVFELAIEMATHNGPPAGFARALHEVMIEAMESEVAILHDLLPERPTTKTGRPPHDREEAKQWLKGVLAGGPLRASVIHFEAEVAGFSRKTLRRAANALGVVRQPAKGGRNCEWRLPASLQ